jgi:hypothetical protein
MEKKVCTNSKCLKKGGFQYISNFHKQSTKGYNSQCKGCVNKSKRLRRLRKQREIQNQFEVLITNVCEKSFVEAFGLLFEEGKINE